MKHIAEAAWVLAFASSFAAAQSPVGAEVQTSSGIVTGHAAPNKTTVSEYLGIPYAQPPLGRLRFAAPLAFNSSQPFDASSYSPDCPQIGLTSPPIKYPNQTTQFSAIISAFGGGRGNPQSEDCLTLNIWTKRPGSRNKTGVLVWIHGGRFTLGNTNTPFYQGQYIVESEDIVFVSINYRTNIFGFSGAPSEPQNAGLLDQRMAIEWVRDNIAGFGGDPERISIMGQSAGGSAVDFYAYAHTTDPIVAGLISVSGTALSFLPNTPDFSHQSFLAAAASVGCTGSDEDLVVACMRQVEFKILLNATRSVKPLPSAALIQPVFHPTVDNKTVFTRQDYLAKGQAGEFARIPFLAGTTDQESGFYQISALGSKITLTEPQWDLFELEGFTCATATQTAVRAKAAVPTWRYRYFGAWPNLELYPGSGAYHGSDLHMVFGGAEDVSGLPNTQQQTAAMQYQMRAWAAFVNHPSRGLTDVMAWPLDDPQEARHTLVRLAYQPGEGGAEPSFVDPNIFDTACPVNGSVAEAQGAF